MAAIRDRIHTARAQRRWTQAELGRALGVDRSTVSRWERGEAVPSAVQRAALARLFGRPPGWLQGPETPEPSPPDRISALREEVRAAVGRLHEATEEIRRSVEAALDELEGSSTDADRSQRVKPKRRVA